MFKMAVDGNPSLYRPEIMALSSVIFQERFVQDNFLKMDLFAQEANNSHLTHRSSISAKFLTRGGPQHASVQQQQHQQQPLRQ